jgi:serine/threonine protein kinase
MLNSCSGTYYYMAPEVIQTKKLGGFDAFKADIWSLGITMYSFAYLIVPFKGNDVI